MKKGPVKYIPLSLACVITLAPICENPEEDLQNEERTTTIINYINPEKDLSGKETELHNEELTFQDNLNVSGTSYVATGTNVSLIFGGEAIEILEMITLE